MIELNKFTTKMQTVQNFCSLVIEHFNPGGTEGGGGWETYLLLSGPSSFIHLVIKRIIVNLFLNKPH